MQLPDHFRYSAVACGVRPDVDRLDLALVISDRPARAAGVFTQNLVAAAPVVVSRAMVPSDSVRGFVVCAGNANACTGDKGIADAKRMCAEAARAAELPVNSVLVASTGVIGRPLPIENICKGIAEAAKLLNSGSEAANSVTRSIMTTDTKPKTAVATFRIGSVEHRIFGFAKGAAMIGPNLATMLGFLLTDAPISSGDLQSVLAIAADRSFNCISVEGHTSTNDTLFALANGEGRRLNRSELPAFCGAMESVCGSLAEQIAEDAEGAEHLIILEVTGLATDSDARRIAKCVADSPLVKTAIYGGDPNWGRVVSAAGYAGVPFAERDLSLRFGDMVLYDRGLPLPFDAETASNYLKTNRRIKIRLSCGSGPGGCTFRTCDLTPEYVRLNADYTT